MKESGLITTAHENRVLEYMRKHTFITQKEAMDNLGESRLSARVFTLKKKGYAILGEYITVTNRHGEKCRVKRYCLIE